MSTVVIVGNMTSDPELRFTGGGKAITTFSVAESRGKGDKKQTYFWNVEVWNSDYDNMADNAAATLQKGMRVIVVGRGTPNQYEKDGKVIRTINVTADSVGPDLKYATATVDKIEREKAEYAPPAPEADIADDLFKPF